MKSFPKITVSKLDAARRQLETAIRIYFGSGDPVSIHTLTSAAYNILRDLTRAKGADPMIVKDKFMEWVRPGFEKEFRDKMNQAENFFKHADKDPGGILEFAPSQSELMLFDACAQYQTLTSELLPIFQVFHGWFVAHHNEYFDLPPHIAQAMSRVAPDITSKSRGEYFQEMLSLITAYRA